MLLPIRKHVKTDTATLTTRSYDDGADNDHDDGVDSDERKQKKVHMHIVDSSGNCRIHSI